MTPCTDLDLDGFFAQAGCGTVADCDDARSNVRPGGLEVCADGRDNGCDGRIDEGCTLNLPPTASAGVDLATFVGSPVTLEGSGTDPEGAALSYTWTQVTGPSVGPLAGAQPTFTAPPTPSTLTFDLVTSDGVQNSAPDRVVITVGSCSAVPDEPDPLFRDTNCDGIDGDASRAVFVAPSGSDTNPGTRAQPVATLAHAIGLAGTTRDVFVSAGTYSVGELALASGVSLYGLYDAAAGWSRAAGNVTRLEGATTTLRAQGLDRDTRVEGFELVSAAASGAGESRYGVRAIDSTGRLILRFNTIRAGAGSSGLSGGAGAPGAPSCQPGGPGGGGGFDGSPGQPGQAAPGGSFGGSGGGPTSGSCGPQAGPGGRGGSGFPGSQGAAGGAGGSLGPIVGGLYAASQGVGGSAGSNGKKGTVTEFTAEIR